MRSKWLRDYADEIESGERCPVCLAFTSYCTGHTTCAETVARSEPIQRALLEAADAIDAPIHMRLPCPECHALHIDEGLFATKVHHTHACQECGCVWRPAVVPTIGVRFLPGFLNEDG